MKKWNLLGDIKPDNEEIGTLFEIILRHADISSSIVQVRETESGRRYLKILIDGTDQPRDDIYNLLSTYSFNKDVEWRYVTDNEKMAYL